MFPLAVDDHTQLRLLQQQHAPALFEVVDRHRDHLRTWLPWVDGTRVPQDTLDFVTMKLYAFAQRGLMTCGIWHDGLLCGVIGHNAIDPTLGTVTVGYWLAADLQGRGIMTRCVVAFVQHAFEEYGLEVVEIHVGTDNHRSRAIPERLGFTEGERVPDAMELADRTVDHVVYRLAREGWRP